jgi:creatinine amidohydrolase
MARGDFFMPVINLEKASHKKLLTLDKSKSVVLASVSPLEVHGPHLPIGQDLFEAYSLAGKTAEALAKEHPDWTFLLLPPIPVAVDCVPKLGSVNFPVQLVRDVAYHALEPFAKEGFARLAYSSFHGGPRHIVALEDAADRLTKRYGVPALSFFSVAVSRMMEGNIFHDAVKDMPSCRITLEQTKQDHHAGFVETSMGLHLWPELVEKDWKRLPHSTAEGEDPMKKTNTTFFFGYENEAGLVDQLKRAAARTQSVARAIRHFRSNTYSGFPAFSSPEAGKKMFDHLVGIAKNIFLEFMDRGAEMEGHSPLWPYRAILLNGALNHIVEDWLKLY